MDVNVHPTKHEVHFLYQDEIVEKIQRALESKVSNYNEKSLHVNILWKIKRYEIRRWVGTFGFDVFRLQMEANLEYSLQNLHL